MRIGSLVLVIWLVIGAFAAYQRDYFSQADTSCNHLSDTALTIVAGPLNYFGVNPKIDCKTPDVPQPSE